MIAALVVAAVNTAATTVYLVLAVRFERSFEHDRAMSEFDRWERECIELQERIGALMLPAIDAVIGAARDMARAIEAMGPVFAATGEKIRALVTESRRQL